MEVGSEEKAAKDSIGMEVEERSLSFFNRDSETAVRRRFG